MTPQLIVIILTCLALAIIAGILFTMAQIRYEKSKKLRKESETVKGDCLSVDLNPVRYGMTEANTCYDVYSVHRSVDGKREAHILIKRFDFGDDRDFAMLEAQELLDHLNEK